MAEHNELGEKGEELARIHLREKGYKILKTNWRFGNDEIDIIAEKDDQVIFVKVKTRSSNYLGEPEIFVTKKKQGFIIRAANAYLTRYEVEKEARLDVVSIVLSADKCNIRHIERAFYPTL